MSKEYILELSFANYYVSTHSHTAFQHFTRPLKKKEKYSDLVLSHPKYHIIYVIVGDQLYWNSIGHKLFSIISDSINPSGLEIKDAKEYFMAALYLNILLNINVN